MTTDVMLLKYFSQCFMLPIDLLNSTFSVFLIFMNKSWLFRLNRHSILCLSALHVGVLDQPGSEFAGILWLHCDQVLEDPAGSEASQSSLQIRGHAGEMIKERCFLNYSYVTLVYKLISKNISTKSIHQNSLPVCFISTL